VEPVASWATLDTPRTVSQEDIQILRRAWGARVSSASSPITDQFEDFQQVPEGFIDAGDRVIVRVLHGRLFLILSTG